MNSVAYVDHLLRDREEVARDFRFLENVKSNTAASFLVFLAMSLFYGLIMGSQNLIRGEAEGWKFALASSVKLPLLFLLTLLICMPLFYVLNVLIGPRLRFTVVLGLLISSIAVTGIVLGASAPIVLFFMLSTKSYAFIKLLNVLVFSIAGGYGVWFLGKSLLAVVPEEENEPALEEGQIAIPKPNSTGTILRWWLVTYGVVGSQMGWILKPFIGDPNQVFTFFRQLDSNFYMDVLNTIGKLLSAMD